MTANGYRSAASLLLLAGAVACNAVEEDRGPALTPADLVAEMPNWSADGTEIYFVRPGHGGNGFVSTLSAVSMDGQVRLVDGGKKTFWAMATAPNGPLYYVATVEGAGERPLVFSTATSDPVPITLGGRGVVLAISPDGARIAYVGQNEALGTSIGPGQLKLYTLADGSVTTLSDSQPLVNGPSADYDRALAFSPASDRLFYVTGLADRSVGGLVFDVATGAATTKTWDARSSHPLVHWGEAGLRIADAGSGPYEIVSLDTGERVPMSGAGVPGAFRDAWAPDGSRIAFWTADCLDSCGAFSCCPGKTQYELIAVEVATGRVARVAAAGDQAQPGTVETIGAVAFSPDSRRIAYAIEGRVHVRDIQ